MTDKPSSLPCIVCKKVLEDTFNEQKHNQPYAGTIFVTHGHYGSTFFDPMDGSKIEINVCDDCLSAALKADLIRGALEETSGYHDAS